MFGIKTGYKAKPRERKLYQMIKKSKIDTHIKSKENKIKDNFSINVVPFSDNLACGWMYTLHS